MNCQRAKVVIARTQSLAGKITLRRQLLDFGNLVKGDLKARQLLLRLERSSQAARADALADHAVVAEWVAALPDQLYPEVSAGNFQCAASG